MKVKIILILLMFSFACLNAQIDRSIQPKPGPAPEIKMGNYESFQLENGLKVFVIENNKLPKVNFSLVTVRNPILEGDDVGYTNFAGQLLRRGTKSRTKEQIDEEIDFIGAGLSTSGSGISGSSLKKHFDKLMGIFSDVLLNSEFKQSELDKLKTQMISGLAANKEDPGAIASNLSSVLVYGKDHPYGEVVTEKNVKSITLEKCQNYYKDNFRPNISLLAFVGDINVEEAKIIVDKYLGLWEMKKIISNDYNTPEAPQIRKVAIFDRPSSVQSVINVTYPVNLKKGSEDVIKASVMNTILGGTFSARLNQNLREDKGYTYGAGSSLSSDRFIGRFKSSATVRSSVTDSAIVEIFNEMNRLKEEKVNEEELVRIKNYLTGSFSRALEQPSTIARFALNIEINNLPKDYYKNYLKKLNGVTAEDIQQMAKKYLHPNKSHVIVVGNADEIATGLNKFSENGKIKYYDNYGVEYNPNLKKVPDGVTAKSVIEKYIKAIGGRVKLNSINDKEIVLEGSNNGTNIVITISQKTPNKLLKILDFSVGKQTTIFNGEKGKVEGMGQFQEIVGEQLEQLKIEADLFPFLRYEKDNVELELKGIEEVNGKEVYKILVTSSNGKKNSGYYDIDSGLKLRELTNAKTPQGTFTQTVDLDNYIEVDGIKTAHKIIQKIGPSIIELNVTSVKFNSGLNDSLFIVE